MPEPRPNGLHLRPWAAWAAAALAFALALRYGFFQSRLIGGICLEHGRPWWCQVRDILGMIHGLWIWGWTGLAFGALGFWFGWRWALGIGLVAGILGLVVYNTEYGAVALILSLLGLAGRARLRI
ncbi:MAG: hypothetical protein WCF16_05235 [Alphaproteobacteria bacterium]